MVVTNVTIEAFNITLGKSASLSADGMGHQASGTAGFGCRGGIIYGSNFGGAHGGKGGAGYGSCASNAQPYGDLNAPTTAGGGSDGGSRGGGVVRLQVSGTFTMGHGSRVSSDGVTSTSTSFTPRAGGAAGGSVWISAATFAVETDSLLSAKGSDAGPGTRYSGDYNVNSGRRRRADAD